MSEVSFQECCADSPYPFTKDPNLVSSKLVKRYLQEGGNIDNKVNISYKIEGGKLKNILNDVVKYNINIFENILKLVEKIK